MDISGLDKAKVLTALYNNSKSQGLGAFLPSPTMTEKKAQEIIASGKTSFDYLGGRVLKIDLSGDELDTTLYDRDVGQGEGEKAVNSIRNKEGVS